MVNPGVCGTLNLGSIPRGGTKNEEKRKINTWTTIRI